MCRWQYWNGVPLVLKATALPTYQPLLLTQLLYLLLINSETLHKIIFVLFKSSPNKKSFRRSEANVNKQDFVQRNKKHQFFTRYCQSTYFLQCKRKWKPVRSSRWRWWLNKVVRWQMSVVGKYIRLYNSSTPYLKSETFYI